MPTQLWNQQSKTNWQGRVTRVLPEPMVRSTNAAKAMFGVYVELDVQPLSSTLNLSLSCQTRWALGSPPTGAQTAWVWVEVGDVIPLDSWTQLLPQKRVCERRVVGTVFQPSTLGARVRRHSQIISFSKAKMTNVFSEWYASPGCQWTSQKRERSKIYISKPFVKSWMPLISMPISMP